MRKAKLTSDEILAAEKAADDKQQTRKTGFAKMSERDRGWVRLSNGVIMEWHVARPLVEFEARKNVPDGKVILRIDKEDMVFDAEELKKWLRWA